MKCSRDGANMKEVEIDKIKVDVCGECGGIWFDPFEFEKFDEVHEKAGDQLIRILESLPKKTINFNKRIHCPKCSDTALMRHFASPLKKIAVDECPSCAGVWLDAGELAEYRKLFPTEADRKKAGEEFAQKEIAPMLKAAAQKNQEELKKTRRFANALRFICPSYYIPGKQDGAAF